MKSHRFQSFAVLVIFLFLTASAPPHAGQAAPQVTLQVIASGWKYEAGSTISTDHIEVMAEIRNTSGQYVKDVAVRATLLRISGSEITSATEEPMKVTLAPGESTFYWDTIYSSSAILTADVRLAPFGDAATAADHLYLPDPAPAYQTSYVDGGWVTYFGEFHNTTSDTWRAPCETCTAPELIGVYYDGSTIVDWSGNGAPYGHRAPQSKLAYRFQFERVPGGTFKLFESAEPMKPGEYATRWGVEGFQWVLEDSWFGKQVTVKATVRNLSDVPAEPSIWIVARDGNGKWLGWTYCSVWSDLAPNATFYCDDYISSGSMHMGEAEDVRDVEVLVSSSAITHTGPPTVTPTPSPTPTATLTPTATSTPSATPTMTLTPTATPILDEYVYLPMALK